MTRSCTSEALHSSSKSPMTLEESHCQATKRPNRDIVNARCLWVEGPTTFEKSLYQAAEMQNIGSVNAMGGWTHAPSGIRQSME
jgi:hypothetical protein